MSMLMQNVLFGVSLDLCFSTFFFFILMTKNSKLVNHNQRKQHVSDSY